MSSYIKSTIIIVLLLLGCEKQSVNLDSSSISTNIEFRILAVDSNNTSTFQLNVDSLKTYNSPRLYAGMIDELGSESYILLKLNLPTISEEQACDSNNFSSLKLELNSYNQLVDLEIDEEGEDDSELVSEIYIDTTGWKGSGDSGLKVYLGDLEWESTAIIDYNDFNYDNFSELEFNLEEYKIVIDSLEKELLVEGVEDICGIDNMNLVLAYSNSLPGDDIKDYIEIYSSDYVYEPSQPKIYIDYNLLEEETVIENKFIIEGASNQSDLDFDTYVLNDIESNEWGVVYLLNSDEMGEGFDLSESVSLDTININTPLSSSSETAFEVKIQIPFSDAIYYCEDGSECESNLCDNGEICVANDNLPIELYIDDLIAYTNSDDPEGDNWNDCGSDSICDTQDSDDSEGNGVWDVGERNENNLILDWIDDDGNGQYDYGEELLELYDDFGFDGCADLYEDGAGGCLDEENPLYNPSGTENNKQYNYGEKIVFDYGEDGCTDLYEDGSGGCLDEENSEYDEVENPDPNGDNYNIDPSNDNWHDYGQDGCTDLYEDGSGGCLDEENSEYDEIENPDPNGDNYDFSSNSLGTELNGIWNLGEGTEGNQRWDNGEQFYDLGSNALPDQFEEFPEDDNWYDCGTDGICDTEDLDGTEGNGVWDLGEGTEGNQRWDNGEPFEDYGADRTVNYLEEKYNQDGSENNNQYNTNELYDDYGEDGCADLYEDGSGGCLDEENPEYDEVENPDPNGDNYLSDINLDNWRDCGTDGLCDEDENYIEADGDGSENNNEWNPGEQYEGNNQIDWVESSPDNVSIINFSDDSEPWYDYGSDNIVDELEFFEIGNHLSSNIIHNSNSYVQYYGDQSLVIDDIENQVDQNSDVNVYFSNISPSDNSHEATIHFDLNKPVKAIQFKIAHSPYIFLDSLYNDYTSVYYSNFQDSLIKDISVYPVEDLDLSSNSRFLLNYHDGVQTDFNFIDLESFIQDSTIIINNDYTNLHLYLDYDNSFYSFNSGFSDIYFSNGVEDVFLKRIYFDGPDSVIIPIGGLLQNFINNDIEYNGINLKLNGNGYNFNKIAFYNYSNQQDSIYNPKIEIMYSK